MHKVRSVLVGTFLFLLCLGVTGSWAQSDVAMNRRVKAVAHELVCLCGCGNQVLDSCTCGVAAKERGEIKTFLQAGKTQQEILDIFVARKGWAVLAAPPKTGLNQLLWVFFPYILPVMAVFILLFFLRKWAKKDKSNADDMTDEGAGDLPEDDELAKRLEEDLRKFDE